MNLGLYIAGGFLIWLGGYAYLKTRNSVGMRPTGSFEIAYVCSGWLAQMLAIPYLVAMAVTFTWWIPIGFFIVGSIVTGIVYSKLAIAGGGLPVFCVPGDVPSILSSTRH